ncbi:MAG TPA: hypothetical protein VF043_39110 [Ktedonobacteraceae bacterium]
MLDQTKLSSTLAKEFAEFGSIMSFGFAYAAFPSSHGVWTNPTLTALSDTHSIEFVSNILQRKVLRLSLIS